MLRLEAFFLASFAVIFLLFATFELKENLTEGLLGWRGWSLIQRILMTIHLGSVFWSLPFVILIKEHIVYVLLIFTALKLLLIGVAS